MIFLFAFLVLVAPSPGASIPTPPNPSDSTPSGSMTPRDSELLDNSTLPLQSNTSLSQPGQDSNLIRQPYERHPLSRSSSSGHATQPEQNDERIPSPYFRNPFSTSSESQSNLLPVFQRPSQSTTRVPWYHGNAFYAVERDIPPEEFHIMDHLSSCVIQYVFAWGINFSSQRPNPNISIYIQGFLNQGALSLFLLANAVFPRTHPVLAFILDRLSFLLIVISTYLASLYMFPPYVAIIMFVVVAIFFVFSHFRR